MRQQNKSPEVRFKGFTEDWEEFEIGKLISEKFKPIVLLDDVNYTLLTVKRRNGGIISRGSLRGRDILVKNYFTVSTGDYVISKRQVVHGANGIVPEQLNNAVVSNEYLVIVSNDKITSEYWALISKIPEIHKMFFLSSYGVDIEKLVFDVSDWKKRKINIPSSSEQNAIVETFSNLSSLIAKQKKKHSKLSHLKKAMMSKMFPGNGTKSPELRFKNFNDDWEKYQLGKIGKTFTGLSGKTKDDFGKGNARYIPYTNVFNNEQTDRNQLEKIEIDSSQNTVEYGDVLFTTSSETPEEVGMSSVWLENDKNIYLNSFCFGYRFSEEVNYLFMAYCLRSNIFREKVKFLAQGISRFNISKTKAMEIEILIPKDKEEQQKIGAYFQNLDKSISLHHLEIKKLENIKKACLNKLFVSQDTAN